MNAPAKVVLVLSEPTLSTCDAPLLVTMPPVVVVSPASEPKTEPAMALTSNSAPAATTRREAVSVWAADCFRTPPLTVVEPDQALPTLPSTKMPAPDLVNPPAPLAVTAPPNVPVTSGLDTVKIRLAVPRAMAPLRVTLFVARFPPNVKLPATTTLLLTVCAAPVRIVVPFPIVRVPKPRGLVLPLMSGTPAVTDELLALRIIEPAFS